MKNIAEKRNFNNSKKNYYKHINFLIERINKQMEPNEDKNTIDSSKEQIIKNKIYKLNVKNEDKEICGLCKVKVHNYICPKCKIKYCSLICYKSHNINCTEEFYKSNVIEEMKSIKSENPEIKKFKTNFKQTLETEGDNEEKYPEFISISRRKKFDNLIEKIENNTLDLKSDLTPEDWREFQDFLKNIMNNDETETKKTLEDIIFVWKPFWFSDNLIPTFQIIDNDFKNEIKTIENLKSLNLNEFLEFYEKEKIEEEFNIPNDENIENEEDIEDDLEKEDEIKIEEHEGKTETDLKEKNENLFRDDAKMFIEIKGEFYRIKRDIIIKSIYYKYESLPNITSLTKLKPNANNINSLVFILGSVIYLFRLYNGEVIENIDEIFKYFCDVLCILYDKDIKFFTVAEALTCFITKLSKYEKNNLEQYIKLIEKDFERVMDSKFYIVESFMRLYEIVHKFDQSKIKQIFKQNISLSKHKIIFFLSFIKSLDNNNFVTMKEKINEYFKSSKEISKIGKEIKNLNLIKK